MDGNNLGFKDTMVSSSSIPTLMTKKKKKFAKKFGDIVTKVLRWDKVQKIQTKTV